VLLVEDDALLAISLARVLRSACAVLLARTLSEALALVDQGGFDLLLCDYRLGGECSLPLLQRVAERWPSVRRVVLTADTASSVQRALPEGVAHVVLEKSIDVKGLSRVLGLHFGGARFSHGP
jgi:DNA-binding NarL/FixJ family response regulator